MHNLTPAEHNALHAQAVLTNRSLCDGVLIAYHLTQPLEVDTEARQVLTVIPLGDAVATGPTSIEDDARIANYLMLAKERGLCPYTVVGLALEQYFNQ